MTWRTHQAQVLDLADIQGTVLRQRPSLYTGPTSCYASTTRRTAAACGAWHPRWPQRATGGTPERAWPNVVLSYSGLRALRVRESSLESFPAEFREGRALKGFGRAAMLMESHVPRADSRLVPEAARFAEALEADTAQAAVDVRRHRNPDWGRVEGALHAWEDAAAGDRSPVVRGAGRNCRNGPWNTSRRP